MNFKKRLLERYQVSADGTLQPGSAQSENWQAEIQTGHSAEEVRQMAVKLAEIVSLWQDSILEANDIFETLAANNGRYFEMYSQILNKGVSAEKMAQLATIAARVGAIALIK